MQRDLLTQIEKAQERQKLESKFVLEDTAKSSLVVCWKKRPEKKGLKAILRKNIFFYLPGMV